MKVELIMNSSHRIGGITISLLLVVSPLLAQQLIPAGTLLQCTISEKISSKTTDVGDQVVCQINRSTTLPNRSVITGQFAEFKDPGHFVGKGWMQLDFDRVIVQPNHILPVNAKVVDVKGYKVDKEGRILGKGHATRDIIKWCIPVLWPIDLLMLPGRGPRPTLKAETRLTVKLMDDTMIPRYRASPSSVDEYGYTQRDDTAQAEPSQGQDAPVVSQNAYSGDGGFVAGIWVEHPAPCSINPCGASGPETETDGGRYQPNGYKSRPRERRQEYREDAPRATKAQKVEQTKTSGKQVPAAYGYIAPKRR
jgi:hypothetical protein